MLSSGSTRFDWVLDNKPSWVVFYGRGDDARGPPTLETLTPAVAFDDTEREDRPASKSQS